MSAKPPVLVEAVRINQIGEKRTFSLAPDAETRRAIAMWLKILDLPRFEAELTLVPARTGWHLSGRLTGQAIQACGLTLEPIEEQINDTFGMDFVEAEEAGDASEVEVILDEDSPDIITDGRIDVSRHVLEHLSLALDPFPRKPGAVFVAPEETAEISPFAVLKGHVKPRTDSDD
ncbi:YceD family protein [Brevundimonas sp.]|uniref:YceD family protein n=1 Tax=Brevundimonas sp. TaxID=1871086 RepID=UPI003AF4D8C2